MLAERRCYGDGDELMARYHDEEWGVPVYNDLELFERLLLESFQAGLSWRTILYKRENFRHAFEGMDPAHIAEYGQQDIDRLLADAGIIRNRLKIKAAISNARAFLIIQEEFGSFSDYFWAFSDHHVIVQAAPDTFNDVPAETDLSQRISSDLKQRGFKFVGPTIIYAFMQSVGMVNDHLSWCFVRREES